MKRTFLAALAILALGSISANAQQQLFPFWPIIGGASYCAATGNNGVCTSTIPAGPAMTGNETIPVNTNATNFGPSNAFISLRTLGGLPVTVVPVTTAPAGISASSISGGVLYTSATTITAANITLPTSPVDQQIYRLSSNQTITTLSVTAATGTSMGTNVAPTALTASTTASQGYEFIYNAADTKWYRMQ